MEDNGPAEAIFVAPIVLPNEFFLQGDEIPVDTI
jgi:hypothetical protein